MKYIQLLNQRINLDNIAHYYPNDHHTGVINDHSDGYDYTIRFILNAGGTLTLQYANKDQRDLDLQTLDFVCVQNKRGNVRELKKNQNE